MRLGLQVGRLSGWQVIFSNQRLQQGNILGLELEATIYSKSFPIINTKSSQLPASLDLATAPEQPEQPGHPRRQGADPLDPRRDRAGGHRGGRRRSGAAAGGESLESSGVDEEREEDERLREARAES